MDLRDKILSKSTSLILRIGPQSVTMDMVARECGISKRTLYETFPTKLDMISGVVEYNHNINTKKFTEVFTKAENSFTALMGVYNLIREYMHGTSVVFMTDIKRLYPEVFNKYKQQEHAQINELSKVLEQGKKEGLVMDGINCEVGALLLVVIMKSLHNDEDINNFNYNPIYVFDAGFLNFLRGVATEKGRQIIHTYVEKHFKNETI